MLSETITYAILSLISSIILVFVFSKFFHSEKVVKKNTPQKKGEKKYTRENILSFFTVKIGRVEKILFIACVIVFYFFWSFMLPFNQEHNLKSEEGNFVVKFYSEPILTTQIAPHPLGEIDINTYTSTSIEAVYKVLYYKYPEGNLDTEVKDWSWDEPSKIALAELKGDLKVKDFYLHNNINFLQLVFENFQPNTYQTLSRSCIRNNTYYQIMAIYPLLNSTNKNIKNFFESFKFINNS